MDRNLALELVRVTEAAALSCGRWVGKGDKMSADDAATEAMRRTLDSMEISGTVVIGEGEMDEAPMLYIGERLGLLDVERDELVVGEVIALVQFAGGADPLPAQSTVGVDAQDLHARTTIAVALPAAGAGN